MPNCTRAKSRLPRAQAVVGVEAPAQLEAHLARSEVDLVVDHQDLLGRHAVGAGQL